MSRSMPKQSRREKIDTEDRIMETVATAAVWAQRNRRIATIGLLLVAGGVVAGVMYTRYKADLQQRAAVGLDELRFSQQGAPPEQAREDLELFIGQFAGTPEEAEARVLLGELELRRDSAEAALRVLQPIANADAGTPLGFHAAWMMAAAQEQRGDAAAAMAAYNRLESSARYDYQRRAARAAQARLHEFAGEYAAAERIYVALLEDADAAADNAFYGVRLGEVRARARGDLPPPAVPQSEGTTGAAAPD